MEQTDILAYTKAVRALPNGTATAAGAGDNTEVDGPTIDRRALSDRGHTAMLLVPYTTALASGQSLSASLQFQDSADGSNWDDLEAAQVQSQAGGGGGTFTGVFAYRLPIRRARRYIRVQFTPNLSASGTDTAAWSGVVVIAGQQQLPA